MGENISYPGPAWRPSTAFSVANERARLSTSENSVACQWWRAMPNPLYNESSGITNGGAPGRFILTKQPGTYSAVVAGARQLWRTFPQGSWGSSDIMLSFDSVAFPLSIYDQIILGSSTQDGRHFTQKNTLIRGTNQTLLAGTVANAGQNVTGTGTNFTAFVPGDILIINGESQGIASISSDTALTVVEAYSENYSAIEATIANDLIPYWPAQTLTYVASPVVNYVVGVDVALSADGTSLVWLNPATAPNVGGAIALIYDYYPRFQISEYGIKGVVVNGSPVLDAVAATLWLPTANALNLSS